MSLFLYGGDIICIGIAKIHVPFIVAVFHCGRWKQKEAIKTLKLSKRKTNIFRKEQ